jgi:hypothetical protein
MTSEEEQLEEEQLESKLNTTAAKRAVLESIELHLLTPGFCGKCDSLKVPVGLIDDHGAAAKKIKKAGFGVPTTIYKCGCQIYASQSKE